MLTELHCTCGHITPIEPAALKPMMPCSACGTSLRLSRPDEESRWLLIGGAQGPPRLAVPVPIGAALVIGAAANGWLALPGEGVEAQHAELSLAEDGRLRVKHVGKAGGTWINRARILEGVLKEGDSLAIGPYRLQLTRQRLLPKSGRGEVPSVILEDEPDVNEPAASDEVDEEAGSEPDLTEQKAPRQTVKWAFAIIAIAGSIGYIGWWLLSPRFSKNMPVGTVYRCPVDGTVFRGEWTRGPPKCPHCGALCLGNLRYKSEKTGEAATSAPTTQPAPPPSAPTTPSKSKPPPTAPKSRKKGGGS